MAVVIAAIVRAVASNLHQTEALATLGTAGRKYRGAGRAWA